MRYTLALAIGGLMVCGSAASAQLNPVTPGQFSLNGERTGSAVTTNSFGSFVLDSSNGFGGLSTSDSFLGDGSNPLFELDLGDATEVTGLNWNLQVSTDSPGLLSDLRLAIFSIDENGDAIEGLVISPGFGRNTSGTGLLADEDFGASVNGILQLADLGASLPGGVDGSLYVEVYTAFPDHTLRLEAGSTFQLVTNIPAPGALAAVGLGGLLAARRRR